MKTNLKNFPDFGYDDGHVKWKEDFEAELREILRKTNLDIFERNLIREILGEK